MNKIQLKDRIVERVKKDIDQHIENFENQLH